MCSFLELAISLFLGFILYMAFTYGLAWAGALGREAEYQEFEKECRERGQFKEDDG